MVSSGSCCDTVFKENSSCASKVILGTVYFSSYSPGTSHPLHLWSQACEHTVASGSSLADQGNTTQVCASSCHCVSICNGSILTEIFGPRWIFGGRWYKKRPVKEWPQHCSHLQSKEICFRQAMRFI